MEWIFATAVLYFVVTHRTFRHVVFTLGLLAVLAGGSMLYVTRPQPQVHPASDQGRDLSQELYGTPASSRGESLYQKLYPDTARSPELRDQQRKP